MAPFEGKGSLISTSKIRGTAVYNTNGETLGSIDDLMIDRQSGRIAYALMSFGGFLGIGERYHPLPWGLLKYDKDIRGYVAPLTRETLMAAPHYGRDEEPEWDDRSYEERIHDYYKTDRYWISPMP